MSEISSILPLPCREENIYLTPWLRGSQMSVHNGDGATFANIKMSVDYGNGAGITILFSIPDRLIFRTFKK